MIVADGALAGKTVVVSGASSGIGLAAAQRIHDLGAAVTALARRREAMEEGLGELEAVQPLDAGPDAFAELAAGPSERLKVFLA